MNIYFMYMCMCMGGDISMFFKHVFEPGSLSTLKNLKFQRALVYVHFIYQHWERFFQLTEKQELSLH